MAEAILLLLILGIGGWAYQSQMPAFVAKQLGMGVKYNGWLLAMNGLGACTAALTVANLVDYNAKGMSYAKLGQYQLAIEDYNEAILQKPDYADALYNRVVAYDKLNQHQNKPLKII